METGASVGAVSEYLFFDVARIDAWAPAAPYCYVTWTSCENGFNATPGQVADKISEFYKAHPEEVTVTVVEFEKQ